MKLWACTQIHTFLSLNIDFASLGMILEFSTAPFPDVLVILLVRLPRKTSRLHYVHWLIFWSTTGCWVLDFCNLEIFIPVYFPYKYNWHFDCSLVFPGSVVYHLNEHFLSKMHMWVGCFDFMQSLYFIWKNLAKNACIMTGLGNQIPWRKNNAVWFANAERVPLGIELKYSKTAIQNNIVHSNQLYMYRTS